MIAGTTVSIWQALRATWAERRTATALETAKTQRQVAETGSGPMSSASWPTSSSSSPARPSMRCTPRSSRNGCRSSLGRHRSSRSSSARPSPSTSGLPPTPGRDAEARHRALHASVRVGEIQWKFAQLAEAERAFRQSLTLAQGLVREAPDRPEYRRDEVDALSVGSARCCCNRAERRGRVPRAAESEAPGTSRGRIPTPNNQLREAELLLDLGRLLENTGGSTRRKGRYRRGLAILEELGPKHAHFPLYRRT